MNRTLQRQIATSAKSSAISALALATLLFLGVLAAAHAQTNYQRIKSFGFLELSGGGPSSALIEGNDGKLYGTGGGGVHSLGTVFKLNKDGSGYTVLHSFGTITGDGRNPSGFAGGLVEGRDGALYGTTQGGGSNSGGTLKLVNPVCRENLGCHPSHS